MPKQFLPVKGKPVLMRTMERFREYSADIQIILVLPKTQQDYWQELCKEYNLTIDHTVADGGETRFHSVQNGLSCIPDDEKGVVGVHDGVRPFVSVDVISRCYTTARTAKAVIPVTAVIETLRHKEADGHGRNVLRSEYCLVQTPQTFDIQMLKAAYRQSYSDAFTDDASVVENAGVAVTMVEGNRENIKITTPFDLRMAQMLAE